MPIKFKCPSCDQMLGIARRKAGSVVSCPRCSYPATVPLNDGETARPAAVGRASSRPAFERGDFDRWIGVRQSGGGGTALASPPAAVAELPQLSESHSGLLDAHRQRVQQESTSPVIDVRLAVALILGAGLLSFGGGYWMGRSSAFAGRPITIPQPTVDSNKAPPAAVPDSGVLDQSKYVLTGEVKYRTGAGEAADAGARVLAFPTNQKPLKKLGEGGLKPGDDKALDQTGVDGLQKIGGVAGTVDAQGRYSLPLPKEGAYWVLVISKNASRPGPLTLQVEEQKLHTYFADVGKLLGNKEFALVIRRAMTHDDGSIPALTYSPRF